MGRPRTRPDTPAFVEHRARNLKWWAARKEEYTHFDFRISREDHADIAARAKKQRVSMAELIRQYITWGLENDEACGGAHAADTKTNDT